jgi:hypothetical protein|tara:strand:- start:12403 stop:13224 length:822 start_codon:yes stop_codon:yes gene_type:complete
MAGANKANEQYAKHGIEQALERLRGSNTLANTRLQSASALQQLMAGAGLTPSLDDIQSDKLGADATAFKQLILNKMRGTQAQQLGSSITGGNIPEKSGTIAERLAGRFGTANPASTIKAVLEGLPTRTEESTKEFSLPGVGQPRVKRKSRVSGKTDINNALINRLFHGRPGPQLAVGSGAGTPTGLANPAAGSLQRAPMASTEDFPKLFDVPEPLKPALQRLLDESENRPEFKGMELSIVYSGGQAFLFINDPNLTVGEADRTRMILLRPKAR